MHILSEIIIFIKIKFFVTEEKLRFNPIMGIRINDQKDRSIFTTQKHLKDLNANKGENETIIKLPKALLVPNTYNLNIGFHIKNQEVIFSKEKILSFSIEETGTEFNSYLSKDYGCVIVNCKWEITQ